MMTSRYTRQEFFQPLGREGRERISRASAVVIGCGAVGSATAAILARSGISRLRLIDRDIVRLSHLQEQSLYTEKDAREALPRASAAAGRLRKINSELQVDGLVEHLSFANIGDLCEGFDFLVDGLDNFETRFLVNEFSVSRRVPWIYASVLGAAGTARVILPGSTPCLRCLFPEEPSPGSSEVTESAGVISPVIHAVASFQAVQVLKLAAGVGINRGGLQLDLWQDRWGFESGGENPSEDCPCCGGRDFPYLEGRVSDQITTLCGSDSVQINPAVKGRIVNLKELAERLGKKNILRCNDYLLQARIDDYELTVFSNGRSIIKGVKDQVEARILYSRYIGN